VCLCVLLLIMTFTVATCTGDKIWASQPSLYRTFRRGIPSVVWHRGPSTSQLRFVIIDCCPTHPFFTIGDRVFLVAASRLRNTLPPQNVTSASSLTVSRKRLNTHLFSLSFPKSPVVPTQWHYSPCFYLLIYVGEWVTSTAKTMELWREATGTHGTVYLGAPVGLLSCIIRQLRRRRRDVRGTCSRAQDERRRPASMVAGTAGRSLPGVRDDRRIVKPSRSSVPPSAKRAANNASASLVISIVINQGS